MKYGLITHYDLDAATSNILLNKVYNFGDNFMCGGYPKLERNINHMIDIGVDHLLVADLSIPIPLFKEKYKNFKYITIFDHHETTAFLLDEIKQLEKTNNNNTVIKTYIDYTKSTSAIITETYFSYFKSNSNLLDLVAATNAYDVWIPNHKLFKLGYDLTYLFFKYGMWDFIEEFKNGIRPYKDSEKENLNNYYSERDKTIFTTPQARVGSNSVLFITSSSNYINDYALSIPGFNTYHVLRKDGNQYKLSSRVPFENRGKGYDLVKSSREISVFNQHIVESCGGHTEAIGIAFKTGSDEKEVIEFVDLLAEVTEKNLLESI